MRQNKNTLSQIHPLQLKQKKIQFKSTIQIKKPSLSIETQASSFEKTRFIEVCSKSHFQRTEEENLTIFNYLNSKTTLSLQLKSYFHQDFSKIIISSMSSDVEMKSFPKSSFLFRTNDASNNEMYILIQGKLTMIYLKKEKIRMKKEEFSEYLKNLLENEEYFSYDQVVSSNKTKNKQLIDCKTLIDERRSRRKSVSNCQKNKKVYNSVIDFIDSVNPYRFIRKPKDFIDVVNEVDEEKVMFDVIIYYIVNRISEGSVFGAEFITNSHKEVNRKVSIYLDEDSKICIIPKRNLDSLLKTNKINEIVIKDCTNLEKLYEFDCFRGNISKKDFFSTYSFLFSEVKFEIGSVLFRQGQGNDKIYFTINSEIEFKVKSTLEDIRKFVIEKYNIDFDVEETNKEIKKRKGKMSFIHQIQSFKVFLTRKNEILGMRSMFFKENSIFTVTTVSKESIMYVVNKDLYDNVLKKIMMKSLTSLEKRQDFALYDRLRMIYKSQVKYFYEKELFFLSLPCLDEKKSQDESVGYSKIRLFDNITLMNKKDCLDKTDLHHEIPLKKSGICKKKGVIFGFMSSNFQNKKEKEKEKENDKSVSLLMNKLRKRFSLDKEKTVLLMMNRINQ